MTTYRYLVPLLAFGLAACSSANNDLTSDTDMDVAVDADTGGDSGTDTEEDADAGEEVDSDAGEEVDSDTAPESEPLASVESVIGPDGGEVVIELPGGTEVAAVEIPPGAVSDDVVITIEIHDPATWPNTPQGYEFSSWIYVFGPAGHAFDEPLTVSLPFSGDGAGLSMYWRETDDESSWVALATDITGRVASAPVSRLSVGFVGRPSEGLCEDLDACGSNEVCAGGRCTMEFDTLDVAAISAHFAALRYGVVTGVDWPTQNPDCCFDLTGDGRVDNALGVLIGLWDSVSGDGTFQTNIEEVLRYKVFGMLLGAGPQSEDGRADLSLLVGINDIDLDGLPDQSLEEHIEGLSQYRLHDSSLAESGIAVNFADTLFVDGNFRTERADFALHTPLFLECSFRFHETEPRPSGARCRGEESHELVLAGLRMEGDVSFSAGGISSVDTAEEYGVRVGGAIRAEDLATFMNAMYSDGCRCAGIGEDDDLIVVSEGTARVGFACAETFEDIDTSACITGQRMCHNIPDTCDAVKLLGALADVDTDGDDVLDGYSFGFRARLSPATLGGEGGTLQPPAESCNSGEDEDGDGLVDCDDPYCWDDTNCGGLGHTEWCRDGRDNDGDGEVDCEDNSCSGNLACVEN